MPEYGYKKQYMSRNRRIASRLGDMPVAKTGYKIGDLPSGASGQQYSKYGSPEYGLWSGYVQPMLSQRGQLPPNFQRITPQWMQENVLPSITGSIGAFGPANRVENIKPALDILKKFGVKHRNMRIMDRNIDRMMKKVHPDKFKGTSPEKVGHATQGFQELGWARDVINANKGNLRVYGIF